MNILEMVNSVEPIYNMPFSTVVFMFMVFSFTGWCCEVLYVGLFFEHKFVNRGFLHGPVCPIYGCGGLVILFLPKILYPTWIPLFFASMLLCSAVEYFSSWILEKMFHTLWWDYSKYKFNINGRVCLLNSVLFGLMGMIAIHFVIPLMMSFIEWLGPTVVKYSSGVFALAFMIDEIFTVKGMVDFHATMEKVKVFAESLKDHYEQEKWFKGESIQDIFNSVKMQAEKEKGKISHSILEKIEAMQSRKKSVERLLKKFPTMRSRENNDAVTMLRNRMKERLSKHRK